MHFQKLTPLASIASVAWTATVPSQSQLGQYVLGDVGTTGATAAVASNEFNCDLPPVLAPKGDGLPDANDIFSGDAALEKQVERHSAIVKVPSICYDDLGDFDKDPRWKVFYELHDTLAKTYPLIHSHFEIEKVNTFGLVFTLEGSNESLKPILLTAHQDVVPVADASTWKYPPFGAHFDGEWLWGRGASDDKNSLTGLFSALETILLNEGWAPKRTIIVALGFDEECSGRRGAGFIGKHLEEKYGTNSLAIILDEGGMGLQLLGDDILYALPAVTEKGHIDVWYQLNVVGGHSSVPFPHTGIGIISEIVTALEAHPYEPKLIKGSPIYNHLVCQARYSPDADKTITDLIKKGDLETLAAELVTIDRPTQYRIQTSQSVDYISGGQKINAMPEVVKLGVNYRVAPHNSIAEIQHNAVEYVRPIAKKYGLTIKAFEGEKDFEAAKSMNDLSPLYDVDYNGTLTLTSSQRTLNAPVSPTSGSVWDVFSGTIQHSFAFSGGKVVPVGELMTGNTDTRHYLELTPNVYRWVPTRQGYTQNAHTINERINMHAHLEALRFYYTLIRNFDASDA